MNGQNNFQNAPGKSTRGLAQNRREKRKNIGLKAATLIFTATAILLAYLYFGHPAIVTVAGLLILFSILVNKIDGIVMPEMDNLFRRERHAVKGALAEEKIGALLDGFGNDFVVLHDVNTNSGNIDHLVFRKNGAIFLIETKSHYGKITQQNGQLRRGGQPLEKDFIGQAHKNIFWLKEFLKTRLGFEPPWIHAVIVFSNGHVEKHLKIKGVAVININFLSEWIQRQPGNAKVAAMLWQKIENLKSEHISAVPNSLAPLPALR